MRRLLTFLCAIVLAIGIGGVARAVPILFTGIVDSPHGQTFAFSNGNYDLEVNIAFLQSDGLPRENLDRKEGDFYCRNSTLQIPGVRNPSFSVPEPPTMFLLGSGLVGLSIFWRKARK